MCSWNIDAPDASATTSNLNHLSPDAHIYKKGILIIFIFWILFSKYLTSQFFPIKSSSL